MKILHIGLTVNRDKNIGLSKAFRKYADVYEEFPISEQLPQQINSLQFKPDIIFCQIQSDRIGNQLTNGLLKGPLEGLMNGSFIIWSGS